MCSVLLQYLKIYGNSEDLNNVEAKRKTSEARYDMLTNILDSGLEAAATIDSNTEDKAILDSVWDRIIATVSSLLLPPKDNRYEGYAYHSKSILNIVAVVLSRLPTRKLSMAEPMLENGANRAVKVAFECNEKNQDDNIPYTQAAEGAGEFCCFFDIFLLCLNQYRAHHQLPSLINSPCFPFVFYGALSTNADMPCCKFTDQSNPWRNNRI